MERRYCTVNVDRKPCTTSLACSPTRVFKVFVQGRNALSSAKRRRHCRDVLNFPGQECAGQGTRQPRRSLVQLDVPMVEVQN